MTLFKFHPLSHNTLSLSLSLSRFKLIVRELCCLPVSSIVYFLVLLNFLSSYFAVFVASDVAVEVAKNMNEQWTVGHGWRGKTNTITDIQTLSARSWADNFWTTYGISICTHTIKRFWVVPNSSGVRTPRQAFKNIVKHWSRNFPSTHTIQILSKPGSNVIGIWAASAGVST